MRRDIWAGKKYYLAGNKFEVGKRWRRRGILFGGIFFWARKGNHAIDPNSVYKVIAV